jgi:hypothetical protein
MRIQKVPGGAVTHLAYSPDGRTLYTLDSGGWLSAWDTATFAGGRIAHGPWAKANFPRGLYALSDGRLLIRTEEFTLLDSAGTILGRSAPPKLSQHSDAQVRPDGRVYYIGRTTYRTVTGWDAVAQSPVPGFALPDSINLLALLQHFDIAPDGRSVAASFQNDETPVLFTKTESSELRDPVPITGVRTIYGGRFSPDGQTLILFLLYPTRLALWDIASRSVRAGDIKYDPENGPFAFNPAYPLFAVRAIDGAFTVRRLSDGQPVQSLDIPLGKSIPCAAFAPDGLTCAIGGSNKQFAVFDVDI